ncbi:MAG: hypothetical protein WCP15_01495 [bacterium]
MLTEKKLNWKLLVVLLSSIVLIGILVWVGLKVAPTLFMKKTTDFCSTYFEICVVDQFNKWKVTSDSPHDFNLSNENEGIMLFLAYSKDLEFKGGDAGFTSISLLGQSKQAYKENKNDFTQVITGINYDKHSLILLLASDKDISAKKTQEITDLIKEKIK